MNIDALLASVTPEIYQKLRTAVELGKWEDGTPLTQEQKDNTLHMVMLYQSKILQSDEFMTVGESGEIVHKTKRELKQELSANALKEDPNTIARFSQDDI
ncbi:DUF1315 family protein [Aestuariibacter sp. AA17]|uniref:DUF1315 family protein n=1 Tax=Fluctibacter corallii TaxID=2984329 RepID=A0ABT3A6P5_9ALTE|nr:DUF1315 family protein [Aestuariibacter sp. AA17]MCV2884237.1 DUF1315 family protein [Aestuariibacter sp. AA17]